MRGGYEMTIRDIMTESPATCTPETNLRDVAQMMVECDCGAVPVTGTNGAQGRAIGIITDRDIVTRVVAKGQDPSRQTVREAMTSSISTVSAARAVSDCVCILVIRDRVYCTSGVAKDQFPRRQTVRDAMTSSIVTVSADGDVSECAALMEEHQVRRLIVVDEDERVVGICSQADIALHADAHLTGSLVEEISHGS